MGRGLLVFKGDKPHKKSSSKKSKTHKEKKRPPTDLQTTNNNTPLPPPPHHQPSPPTTSHQSTPTPTLQTGTGLITSSGTVITGHNNTRFTSEFSIGDALVITHPLTRQREMRVVTMRLSDASCAISSAFSSSLVTATAFRYIRAPKDNRAEATKKKLSLDKVKKEEERSAFGTYADKKGSEFVYRKKTENGSYVIKRERVEGAVTRGDLLDMREKKKSDKYC